MPTKNRILVTTGAGDSFGSTHKERRPVRLLLIYLPKPLQKYEFSLLL